MKWIDVKESLPEPFTWVIISTFDGDGNKISTLSFFERRECDGEDDEISWLAHNDKSTGCDEWEDVTAWQLLPEPYSTI